MDKPLPAPPATPRFPWTAALLLPLAAFAVLHGARRAWPNWRPAFLEPGTSAVYRDSGAGFQKVAEVPGRSRALRVSNGGVVWALTWLPGGDGLARLDGRSWKVYGTKSAAESFVLDGEEVWAPTEAGLVHWDGQRWRLHREIKAAAVAAAGGKVWATTRKGGIARYQEGQWKTLPVVPPGGKWDDPSKDVDSWSTVCTSDGSLWLKRQGLWRFAGEAWEPVTDHGHEFPRAALLGATRDSVWLWDSHNLRSVSMDGKVQMAYSPEQTGISPSDRLYDATSRDGRTYFAAWRGIVEFDGTAFRRLALPRGGIDGVYGQQPGPGGALLALGYTRNPAYGYTRYLNSGVPLALCLAGLPLAIWTVRRFQRERLLEHLRVRQAIEHATGETPDQLQTAGQWLAKESSWWGASATVGLPLAALFGYTFLGMLWRDAPRWSAVVIAAAFYLVYVLWQRLVERARPRLFGTTFLLTFYVVLGCAVGIRKTWLLAPFGAWLLYEMAATWFLNRALKRGDYERALRVIARLRPLHPDSANTLVQRGFTLLLAGRYQDSESVLRRAIRLGCGSDPATALEYLGDALMEQGRYDEATRCCEAALRVHAGFRRPWRGMAESLLRQHQNPVRALEYVENIAGPGGPSRNPLSMNGEVRDDYWALKAWALAEAGRTGEVAAAVANAIRHTNAESRCEMAATCYRVGMAMQASGNEVVANGYFQQAQNLDPAGRRGLLARAAAGDRAVLR